MSETTEASVTDMKTAAGGNPAQKLGQAESDEQAAGGRRDRQGTTGERGNKRSVTKDAFTSVRSVLNGLRIFSKR